MRNQRETVLIEAPSDGSEPHIGYGEDASAADVAEMNWSQELQDTDGLTASVYAVGLRPNDPMEFCFKQPASNFPMLDDIREYLQKEYGAGVYRVHLRKGSRIKHNILVAVKGDAALKAPKLEPNTSQADGLQKILDFVERNTNEMNRRFEQLLERQSAPPVLPNPMEQIKQVMDIMGPFLPKPVEPGTATSGSAGALRELLELQNAMKEAFGQQGNADEPMLTTVLREAIPAIKDLAATVIAARSLKLPGTGQAVPAALPPPAVSENMTPEENAMFGVLQSYAPQLQQIDQLATIKADPIATADSVLDQTPEAAYPTLAGVAAPAMRSQALTVLAAIVPNSAPRRDWWSQFLDAVHQALLPADGEA